MEARRKWRERREEDVRHGSLGMPPGISKLLGEMFTNCGVRLHFSEIDNDDTLAAYAEKHGAAVLSRDADFFRYRNLTYTVFNSYTIYDGKLNLKKRGFQVHSSPRSL